MLHLRISLVLPIVLSLLAGFFPSGVTAQDAHYWTEQYGVRSTLLGGAVIGSVADLGAVFYNPGRLALLEDPAFLLSAKVYELRQTRIEDAIGENQDLRDVRLGGAPNLLAGSFNLGKERFAYSFLTRHYTELDFVLRTNQEADIIDGLAGTELFSGEVNWEKELDERWLGLSWAHRLLPNLSIGVSQFVALRNQANLFKIQLQALGADNEVAFLARNREQDFTHFGILWKVGLALDRAPWSFGATLTTPRINLGGSGSYLYEDFFSGIETNTVGQRENVFISNLQDELPLRYRSPWSLGIGAGRQFGKSSLHLGGEWYLPVGAYTILESEIFTGQSSGAMLRTQLQGERKSVFNVGVGAELRLSDRVAVYGSFRTDFSATRAGVNRFVEFQSKTNSAVIRADLFHLATGGVIRAKKINLTLGLAYAYANQETLRPVDLSEERGEIVFGSGRTSTIYWRRIRFIFGFSVPFAKDDSRE